MAIHIPWAKNGRQRIVPLNLLFRPAPVTLMKTEDMEVFRGKFLLEAQLRW